jgi:hypothetical protein
LFPASGTTSDRTHRSDGILDWHDVTSLVNNRLLEGHVVEHLAVRWRNVRGFEDTGWITLRPLTVILGPNNSGKSSLHRPLLLLKQTLNADDTNAALVTRGDLANVGGFVDLVHRKDPTKTIGMGLRFVPARALPDDEVPLRSQPPAIVEIGVGQVADWDVRLTDYRARDQFGRLLLSRSRQPDGSYSIRMFQDYLRIVESEAEPARRAYLQRIEAAIRGDQPWKFLFTSTATLNAAYSDTPQTGDGGRVAVPADAVLYVGLTELIRSRVAEAIGSLSYLGPLSAPQH